VIIHLEINLNGLVIHGRRHRAWQHIERHSSLRLTVALSLWGLLLAALLLPVLTLLTDRLYTGSRR